MVLATGHQHMSWSMDGGEGPWSGRSSSLAGSAGHGVRKGS